MWWHAGLRVGGGLFCFIAAVAVAHGPAVAPSGPTLAPRTHGFMLYLSQPLGGGGGALKPKFGLRFEQVRMAGNTGAPDAGDPMQHRALIGWQMDGLHDMRAANMHVELGSHMTYDVKHGGFAFQSPKAAPLAVRQASYGQLGPAGNIAESRSYETRTPGAAGRGLPAREAFALGEMRAAGPSLFRDITAAAAATFKVHTNSGQSRPFANHRAPEGRQPP